MYEKIHVLFVRDVRVVTTLRDAAGCVIEQLSSSAYSNKDRA
jgi:hypothetical protein